MASLWSSIALPAIVGAAVVALFNDGLPRLVRFARRLIFAFKADNQTLFATGVRGPLGGRTVLMCIVRCAPSRRFRSPCNYNHQASTVFATAIAPEVPGHPDRITQDAVRFQTTGPYSDKPEVFVNIEARGLVEFASPLRTSWNEAGDGLVLPLEEVVAKISVVVDQVRAGAYQRIYGKRRRLDWAVAIAGYSQQPTTNNPMPWRVLTIAGRPVEGRATNSWPAEPVEQFGSSDLKNRSQRTDAKVVVRAVLRDWMQKSGYWTPEADIEELLQQPEPLAAMTKDQ